MATKVHHKYRVGQVIDTFGSDITVWKRNGGQKITVMGPLSIIKQVRYNNRPYYMVETLLDKSGDMLVSQGTITQYCEVLADTLADTIDVKIEKHPELVDRSSKIRESLEDLCTAATTSPIRDKIVELLAVELDTLHTDIAILTEKEAKLLDLMAKVKNL